MTVSGPADHDPSAVELDNEDADAAVVRLDPSGALDATFGDGGIAIFDFGAGKAVDEETYLADNAWGLAARDGGYVLFASSPNQEADRADSDFVIAGLTDTGARHGVRDGRARRRRLPATIDNARNIKVDGQGRARRRLRDGRHRQPRADPPHTRGCPRRDVRRGRRGQPHRARLGHRGVQRGLPGRRLRDERLRAQRRGRDGRSGDLPLHRRRCVDETFGDGGSRASTSPIRTTAAETC